MGASYLLWYLAGGYLALAVFALWFGLSYGGIVSIFPQSVIDLFGARAVCRPWSQPVQRCRTRQPARAGRGRRGTFDRAGSYDPVIWGCLALALVVGASTRLLGPVDRQF